jgi:hypothetical protein
VAIHYIHTKMLFFNFGMQKQKKTWQLYKITTLVLKIILNS